MRFAVLTASLLLAPGIALAIGAPRGDIAAGKARFELTPAGGQSCASCHLKSGTEAIDGNTPLLAGQYADYLAMTLEKYRSGARVNVLMNAQVDAEDGTNKLSDADIANIAAYLAAQPPVLHVYDHSLPKRR
ncbi:MAG TPA: cytochrome C biogenesis protein CcsA [Xanthomonadaceae bacterium]|jgi:cytochrome c553|nr:cytochrome C biogenesis protein CcsA [Xanthomonadaceae bacterium]